MEQREYTRVVFDAKAAVVSSTASLEGSVLNLGLGGLFVQVADATGIGVGEEVVVSMMIGGKSTIMTLRLHGKVLRHQGQALAVQFDPGKIELDSLLLLKTVILSNGGDREKLQREFTAIVKAQEGRLKGKV
jgi:hypothetical protein